MIPGGLGESAFLSVCPWWLLTRQDVQDTILAYQWFEKNQLIVSYPIVTTYLIFAINEYAAGYVTGNNKYIKELSDENKNSNGSNGQRRIR